MSAHKTSVLQQVSPFSGIDVEARKPYPAALNVRGDVPTLGQRQTRWDFASREEKLCRQ